mmetsp:Transcript_96310/g.272301  ORF Transcript_96310/g.272301 Transcript_96310/m.272301 type:complete len:1086 (-) Transcript_96310:42-3299(-)
MSTTNVARDAFDAFHAGDHARCGKLLEQIGTSKAAYDVKAAHNSFINEYYKSGCADPRQLLTQLTQAFDKARERDKKDKGRRRRDEDDEDTYREDEDLSVLRYNQALLCLQLRQYAQATLVLEELFENIEPIDDFLAIKICFLLLELCLLQREPEQAIPVLNYLEKPNAFLTVLRSERPAKVEARVSEEAAEQEDQREKGQADGEVADGTAGDAPAADSATPAAASAVVARPAETPSATQGEAPEGPLPSLTLGAFLPRHGRAPDTISRAEYRFYLLMYRARLSVALKNTKAAKKDVKSALETFDQELRRAPLLTPHAHTTGAKGEKDSNRPEAALRDALHNQQNAMVMVLKAYLEYSRQNVRKAMKLLALCQFNFAQSRSPNDDQDRGNQTAKRRNSSDLDGEDSQLPTDFHPAQDEACASLFFNNLGCIHFMMQKPNLATFYFQKALKAASATGGAETTLLGAKVGLTKPGVISTKHWLDRRAETSYNAGLQMLMCERPAAAFKCFEQCVPVFRTWPRLWLRLAECCIEMHRQASCGSGASGDGEDGANSGATAWTREASRLSGPSQRSTLEACGGERQLSWSIQGVGSHRRWLLTTGRTPPVGRLQGSGESGGDDSTNATGAAASKAADAAGARDSNIPANLSGEGALVHAAMCLRNVLVLTAPMLPERLTGNATAGAEGATDGAGGSAAAGAAGNAAAAAATATAGAGQEKAAASASAAGTNRAKTAPASAGGSGTAAATGSKARDLLESEASLLEDSAMVKMAYVALCQNDYASALRHSRKLLEKNNLLPQALADGTLSREGAVPAALAGKSQGGTAEEAEEAKKQWTFQAQNLPQSPLAGTAAPGGPKFPSSVGCVMLGVLYAAEALLLSGKPTEAKTLLGGFVSGNTVPKGAEAQNNAFQELERSVAAHVVGGSSGRRCNPGEAATPATQDPNEERARAACGHHSPASPLGGLTPPAYVLCGAGGAGALQAAKIREGGKGEESKEKVGSKESGHAALVMYPPAEFPRLGDSQCMLLTNLAALHVQDGSLKEAERCCERALQAQPRALAPLRTLIYILLRKGQHPQALARLKQSRLQAH